MREIVFAAISAALCAAMIWAASRMEEPFYMCAAAFMAAFWGSLVALVFWARIERMERERGNRFRATIIMPWPRP